MHIENWKWYKRYMQNFKRLKWLYLQLRVSYSIVSDLNMNEITIKFEVRTTPSLSYDYGHSSSLFIVDIIIDSDIYKIVSVL